MIIPSHKNHKMTMKLLYMSWKKIHPQQSTYSYKKTLTLLIDLEMEGGEQKIITHLVQEKKGYSSNTGEHFSLCLQPTIEWLSFSKQYKQMRNKGFKCQHQNCETLPWKTISNSFISTGGVPSIQVSPLLTSTIFYYGNTHGSYAFNAYVITSIYHHLIYINNSSIVNSLQQNSRPLKVVFSNPNQLLYNSHALLYHHLFCLSTFHVGFSFQKTIQNNIYKKRKPCCYTIFSNPSGLPLYSY
jgi:hypothetical protein